MKQYDCVKLKVDIKEYKKGSIGIIVELFENKSAYLEMIDNGGNTIGMLYDVPLSVIEVNKK